MVSPPRALKKMEINDLKHRPQIILVNCSKHQGEILKFIDVTSQTFGTHCELCLVEADKFIKQVKLERIMDQYDKVRATILKHLEKLKESDKRIDELAKGVNVTNALASNVMTKINDMENKTHKEIEYLFKRLKEKFTKYNPFKDTKFFIRDKLETASQTLVDLDSQGYLALTTLRNFLKNESRWREESKNFFVDLEQRLSHFEEEETAGEKEFGRIENAFEVFMKSLRQDIDKWLKVIIAA